MRGALPTAAEVVAAADRLEGMVRRTPVEHSAALSAISGTPVFLKLETQQCTGAFKVRGALNAVLTLPAARQSRGLVTASAGNHGLGVAWAARYRGARATVFVPTSAPATKRRRIARLGAELREVSGSYDDAHREAERFAVEHGAAYVHAFSDPAVVAGQGTVAVEIFEQLPTAGTLLVPAGGGGLIGGMGIVARARGSSVRVVGVQSEQTAALHASLRAGRLVSPPMGATLCEGLSGDIDQPSLLLASQVVDEVVLVSETAVRRAIRFLFTEEGIVAEGSAAVVAAALLEAVLPPLPAPLVAVLTGGNLDAAVLSRILAADDAAGAERATASGRARATKPQERITNPFTP